MLKNIVQFKFLVKKGIGKLLSLKSNNNNKSKRDAIESKKAFIYIEIQITNKQI